MASAQEGFGFSYSKAHSQDSINPTQRPFLADLYARAQDASQQDTVAGFDPLQLQAQNMAIDASGDLQPFVNSAMAGNQFLSSGDVLSPDSNPYLSQYADAAVRPIFENLNENVLPGIRGESALTGNVGGSRQGIAEGLAARGALNAAGDVTSGLYNQAYGQGLNAMVQGQGLAPQMANLGILPANILESVGGERQGLAQRQLDNPFQNLSLLAQILGDPTVFNESISRSYGHDRNSGASLGS